MLKTDFIITRASSSDSVYIAEIEKECFSSPWSLYQVESEILRNNVIFLVAKNDNIPIGYVSGQMILDEFNISNIAVTKSFRNMHIGSDLLKELIDKLSNTECAFATLEVRESNIKARKLYEKYGFEYLGIRRDFYSSPRENACIYTLYFNKEVKSC